MKTKICTKCKTDRPISDYYKNKGTKDGLTCWCKSCKSKYQKENPDISRRSNKKSQLKRRYGLTIESRKQMYVDQDGRCLLCDRLIPYSDTVVDHDHDTDKVRGLLCRHCNTSLGWFENRKERILRYIKNND